MFKKRKRMHLSNGIIGWSVITTKDLKNLKDEVADLHVIDLKICLMSVNLKLLWFVCIGCFNDSVWLIFNLCLFVKKYWHPQDFHTTHYHQHLLKIIFKRFIHKKILLCKNVPFISFNLFFLLSPKKQNKKKQQIMYFLFCKILNH